MHQASKLADKSLQVNQKRDKFTESTCFFRFLLTAQQSVGTLGFDAVGASPTGGRQNRTKSEFRSRRNCGGLRVHHAISKGQAMNRAAWWVAGIALVLAPTAKASVAISGTGALGSFTGSLAYSSNGAGTAATLVVDLTNTSPAFNGGFLTAFAFNNPGDLITSVSVASTEASFATLLGGASFSDSVPASPFGDFDIGVTTSGSWTGGGAPSDGLAVGENDQFTFTFGGAGLNALNELSFLSTYNENANSPHTNIAFAARFRGFEDDGSDKVPNEIIPEPASVAVWGCLALIGVPYGIWRRRT